MEDIAYYVNYSICQVIDYGMEVNYYKTENLVSLIHVHDREVHYYLVVVLDNSKITESLVKQIDIIRGEMVTTN